MPPEKPLSAFELATLRFKELVEQRKAIVAQLRKLYADMDSIDAQIRVLAEIHGAAVARFELPTPPGGEAG